MDQKTDSILTYILYTALSVVLLTVLIQNIVDPWGIIVLIGLVIGSITLRNAVIYPSEKYFRFGKLSLLADIILVFSTNLIDQGTSSGIIFYILIADCSLAYSPVYTGFVALVSFLAYHLSQFITNEYSGPLSALTQIGISSLSFLGIYAIMYIAKYEIRQRAKLSETMYELKIKSKQLENTYLKLRETSEELEELTIVAERNRIAREIHDTVGHTLTTVLLELEAGGRLLSVDTQIAKEKIDLAKDQVRRGLQDIRESVRTLQSGKELLEFIPSLELLIEETKKHGEINIKYDIKDLPKLTSSQEKAIFRALQEGLTNGIRHGNSSAFVFILEYEAGIIKFMLQDNGKGNEIIVKGFGLSAMEARIKELGGVLMVSTAPGDGFQVSITIPVEGEIIHEAD